VNLDVTTTLVMDTPIILAIAIDIKKDRILVSGIVTEEKDLAPGLPCDGGTAFVVFIFNGMLYVGYLQR
jgi:hypothetical protein